MENELGLVVDPRSIIRWKQPIQDFRGVALGTYVEGEGSTVRCPHCGLGALSVTYSNTGRTEYIHRREWAGRPGAKNSYIQTYSDWVCKELAQ